jgi:hypothetical protein
MLNALGVRDRSVAAKLYGLFKSISRLVSPCVSRCAAIGLGASNSGLELPQF